MMQAHILIVEDDPNISSTLALSLGVQGYRISTVASIAQARQQLHDNRFDCLLLDVNLPDGDGYSLCADVRKGDTQLPILMLTANVTEDAAVRGIDCGADDYIRKPYGIAELSARIRRVLDKSKPKQIVFGAIRLEPNRRMAWVGEQEMELGKREYDILLALAQRNGEVLTREAILAQVSDGVEVFDRTIDSHLSHLRKKLKNAGAEEQIVPVYGVGYRLVHP